MPDMIIKKDGTDYSVGVIPQSLYDAIAEASDYRTVSNLTCDNGTFGASHDVTVRGKMAYVEIVVIITNTSNNVTITIPGVNFNHCAFQLMNYQGWSASDQLTGVGNASGNEITISGPHTFPYLSIMTTLPLV